MNTRLISHITKKNILPQSQVIPHGENQLKQQFVISLKVIKRP